MWPITFEERLQAWHDLRATAVTLPDSEKYLAINNWWFRAPMITRYLQWDKVDEWPGPWDLLSNDRWCDIARALGIVYTIMMLDPNCQHRIEIASTDRDNLVLIDQGKYILNWAPGELLNIESAQIQPIRSIPGLKLYNKIG
jgi:hypothetical protein